MSMKRRRRRAQARAVMLALLVGALLVGIRSAPWTLGVASGQTIPWPTATPTPRSTDTPTPTNTWAQRPTWTRVPTSVPERPTATLTPQAERPTSTKPPEPGQPTQVPQPTPTLPPEPTQPSPTASPMAQGPSLSPTPEPAALVFEVLLDPGTAGPGDSVHFAVQVANVGRGPAQDTVIEAAFPVALRVRSIDCDRCVVDQGSELLVLTIGHLSSGDQVIASVLAEVVPEAWPGQAVESTWRVRADDVPPQTVQTSLLLPWAELPATGCITNWRGLHKKWHKLLM